MVTSVGTTASTPQTASDTAGVSLAKNFDMFLTLLTTQLKNQDPTSPMDSKEFTNQLVAFSQVEQSINQNKNLEKLIAMFSAQQSSNNLNFIGKIVDINDNEVKLQEGGAAFWAYELPEGVSSVQYRILNAKGEVVRTVNASADENGAFPPGRIEVAWDGKDSTGNSLPAGNYKLEVIAKSAQGKAVEGVEVFARGYVEALETIDGVQYLVVAGNKYLPEDVVSVFPAPPPGSDTGDGGDDEETETATI